MASTNATPVTLDRAKIADGLGDLVDGPHYGRILGPNGKTILYVKKSSLAVPTALVKKAPAKLGKFGPEKNGKWSTVAVADTAAARAVAEYVVAQATATAEKAGR